MLSRTSGTWDMDQSSKSTAASLAQNETDIAGISLLKHQRCHPRHTPHQRELSQVRANARTRLDCSDHAICT